MFSFSQRLHACSSMEAELQGILQGINFAWGKGFNRIIMEMDSVEVFDRISGNEYALEEDRSRVECCCG